MLLTRIKQPMDCSLIEQQQEAARPTDSSGREGNAINPKTSENKPKKKKPKGETKTQTQTENQLKHPLSIADRVAAFNADDVMRVAQPGGAGGN